MGGDCRYSIHSAKMALKVLNEYYAKDKAHAWAYAIKGNTNYAQNTVGTALDI